MFHRLTPLSLVFCLAFAALAAVMASPAAVARAVRVYDVEIKGEAVGPAIQDAMRRVIVRATGRRESAGDPAFNSLVADAQRYVQSSRRVPNGNTLVTFDGAAVEQAITSTGRSVWDRDRPFTFVVFVPALTSQAVEAARGELDKAAEVRGLPINLAPVAVVDSSGAELPREAVLEAAQRVGGDAVLIGRAAGSGPGLYQWTLQTQLGSESWTGPLEAGPNGAADALTRAQEATAGVAELEAVVQVSGVATLNDYAAVSRLLESIPGQKKVSVVETNGSTATFNVLVRGGADTVDRLLGNTPRLAKAGSQNGQLLYTYRP
jgi:Arc/MetJ family transcription regulator/copper chaperone CopZ